MADLTGANLAGADLSRANLSRANLTGADLRGANLMGASLFGANLTGANLSGANMMAADLRDAYLVGANMMGANVQGANLQSAIGIPTYAATAEDFYRWGAAEAQKGNHRDAIEHFNQALVVKPNFAAAVMARGVARYQMGDRNGAVQDAQIAGEMFNIQGNANGYQMTQIFVREVTTPPKQPGSGGGNILNALGGLSSLLLRLLF